jgi:Tfp pilus assembly protein PilO
MRSYKPSHLYQVIQKTATSRQGRAYGTLAFSILVAAFFSIFAIEPTVLTILSLRRQTSDFQLVDEQLKAKVDTLSRLSYTYKTLETDLPVIEAAIPTRTSLSDVISSLSEAATQSNVNLARFSIDGLLFSSTLTSTKSKMIIPQLMTIKFSATYGGSYESLLQTLVDLSRLNRLIQIDSISLTQGKKDTVLEIEGRAFNLTFK